MAVRLRMGFLAGVVLLALRERLVMSARGAESAWQAVPDDNREIRWAQIRNRADH